MTIQTLSHQPGLAERVLKSYLEGIAFFRQQKEKTIAILQKEFRLTDRAEVEGMYVKFLKVVPARPRFPSKGIETVLEDLKSRNPNAQNGSEFILRLHASEEARSAGIHRKPLPLNKGGLG